MVYAAISALVPTCIPVPSLFSRFSASAWRSLFYSVSWPLLGHQLSHGLLQHPSVPKLAPEQGACGKEGLVSSWPLLYSPSALEVCGIVRSLEMSLSP